MKNSRHCERSEAIQGGSLDGSWIASLALAMTVVRAQKG